MKKFNNYLQVGEKKLLTCIKAVLVNYFDHNPNGTNLKEKYRECDNKEREEQKVHSTQKQLPFQTFCQTRLSKKQFVTLQVEAENDKNLVLQPLCMTFKIFI